MNTLSLIQGLLWLSTWQEPNVSQNHLLPPPESPIGTTPVSGKRHLGWPSRPARSMEGGKLSAKHKEIRPQISSGTHLSLYNHYQPWSTMINHYYLTQEIYMFLSTLLCQVLVLVLRRCYHTRTAAWGRFNHKPDHESSFNHLMANLRSFESSLNIIDEQSICWCNIFGLSTSLTKVQHLRPRNAASGHLDQFTPQAWPGHKEFTACTMSFMCLSLSLPKERFFAWSVFWQVSFIWCEKKHWSIRKT